MRVLVTGAAGFLGSHLSDRLIGEGHVVMGVDNLSTGDEANLMQLRNEPRFSFEQCDICEAFDPGPVDLAFNMASPASPANYLQLGIETLRVGAHGTENVLKIAHKYGARVLQASTSECYGDPLEHPQTEEYWGNVNPIGPRSVYDESKRFAEAMVMAYHRYRSVDTRLARIFNTYGPRLRGGDGRVISNFMMQALRGEALTVYGDGRQTRSFCYVDDLIEGLVRLAASQENLPVNLGNPEETTILEAAAGVIEATGSTSAIAFEALPEDDPVRRRPDITKARTLLNWEPRVSLADGLARSVGFFKGQLALEHKEC